jgi:hypothetical protein
MDDDAATVNEAEYYEEPREAIAARTGTPLPTYADDAVDHLHQHRNTYSMHDAKHMKHKISYDLFSTDGSSKSRRRDKTDGDSDDESAGTSTKSKSRAKHDDGQVDFDSLVKSQNFEKKGSKAAKVTEESIEEVPKKSRRSGTTSSSSPTKSSKSGSVHDFFNDDDSGSSSSTRTRTSKKSSSSSEKSEKKTKRKFDPQSIEGSFKSELGFDESSDADAVAADGADDDFDIDAATDDDFDIDAATDDDDASSPSSSSPADASDASKADDVPNWVDLYHAADA